jgi:hypothetical protein
MWLIILVGWLWFPIWILTHCNKPYQISYIYIWVCVCVFPAFEVKSAKTHTWLNPNILNEYFERLMAEPLPPPSIRPSKNGGSFRWSGAVSNGCEKVGQNTIVHHHGSNKKLQVCRSQLTPLMNRERPVNLAQEAGWSRGSKTKRCVTLRLQPNDKQRETRFYHMICSFWRPIFRFTLSVRRLVIWYIKTRWWHCGSCQL